VSNSQLVLTSPCSSRERSLLNPAAGGQICQEVKTSQIWYRHAQELSTFETLSRVLRSPGRKVPMRPQDVPRCFYIAGRLDAHAAASRLQISKVKSLSPVPPPTQARDRHVMDQAKTDCWPRLLIGSYSPHRRTPSGRGLRSTLYRLIHRLSAHLIMSLQLQASCSSLSARLVPGHPRFASDVIARSGCSEEALCVFQ
jgi:hypothetical protein